MVMGFRAAFIKKPARIGEQKEKNLQRTGDLPRLSSARPFPPCSSREDGPPPDAGDGESLLPVLPSPNLLRFPRGTLFVPVIPPPLPR